MALPTQKQFSSRKSGGCLPKGLLSSSPPVPAVNPDLGFQGDECAPRIISNAEVPPFFALLQTSAIQRPMMKSPEYKKGKGGSQPAQW